MTSTSLEVLQPVVLTGFAAQCVRDSTRLTLYSPTGVRTLASFAQHSTTEVDVACKEVSQADSSSSSGCYSGEARSRQSVSLKFGDFVDYYCASHGGTAHWLHDVRDLEFYLCQCPIAVIRPDDTCTRAVLPRIMDDFVVPETLPFSTSALRLVNLWIAVRPSRTNLHYDAYANVLVVLHGRKSVTLFAPTESGNVYAHPVYSVSANHSPVDVSRPDPTAHPRFARASAQTFVVHAGDALVIPEGWWHHVETDAFTIAINYWFDGMEKQLTALPLSTVPYCARVLLQTLLKHEATQYLAARCVRAVGQSSNEQMDANGAAAHTSNRTVERIVAAQHQDERERALFCVASDDRVFRVVQLDLATQYPTIWATLLENASDDVVALLTDCWERDDVVAEENDTVDATGAAATATATAATEHSNSTREQQEDNDAFMATLFRGFADRGDQIRAQLIAKKSAFAKRMCANVVSDTFGLDMQ